MNRSAWIFFQFLRRDIYVNFKGGSDYVINFVFAYPLMFTLAFGYIQPNAQLIPGNFRLGTLVFAGSILLIMMILTYRQTITLLFDLESQRYVDFQITLLNPRLVIIERVLFSSLFTFCVTLPYFPIAKLLLQHRFDTSATSWPSVIAILYLGSLCCSAYHMFAACALKSARQLTILWVRCNLPLFTLGGQVAPWSVMAALSPVLGYVVLANPMLYMTEGLRQSFLGGPQFLPLWACIIGLVGFSVLFTALACYVFKRRVDHL